MDDLLDMIYDKIVVIYKNFYDDVYVGGYVFFDDGLLDMKIDEKDEVNCELVIIV